MGGYAVIKIEGKYMAQLLINTSNVFVHAAHTTPVFQLLISPNVILKIIRTCMKINY